MRWDYNTLPKQRHEGTNMYKVDNITNSKNEQDLL
jgi:hypothetical protein